MGEISGAGEELKISVQLEANREKSQENINSTIKSINDGGNLKPVEVGINIKKQELKAITDLSNSFKGFSEVGINLAGIGGAVTRISEALSAIKPRHIENIKNLSRSLKEIKVNKKTITRLQDVNNTLYALKTLTNGEEISFEKFAKLNKLDTSGFDKDVRNYEKQRKAQLKKVQYIDKKFNDEFFNNRVQWNRLDRNPINVLDTFYQAFQFQTGSTDKKLFDKFLDQELEKLEAEIGEIDKRLYAHKQKIKGQMEGVDGYGHIEKYIGDSIIRYNEALKKIPMGKKGSLETKYLLNKSALLNLDNMGAILSREISKTTGFQKEELQRLKNYLDEQADTLREEAANIFNDSSLTDETRRILNAGFDAFYGELNNITTEAHRFVFKDGKFYKNVNSAKKLKGNTILNNYVKYIKGLIDTEDFDSMGAIKHLTSYYRTQYKFIKRLRDMRDKGNKRQQEAFNKTSLNLDNILDQREYKSTIADIIRKARGIQQQAVEATQVVEETTQAINALKDSANDLGNIEFKIDLPAVTTGEKISNEDLEELKKGVQNRVETTNEVTDTAEDLKEKTDKLVDTVSSIKTTGVLDDLKTLTDNIAKLSGVDLKGLTNLSTAFNEINSLGQNFYKVVGLGKSLGELAQALEKLQGLSFDFAALAEGLNFGEVKMNFDINVNALALANYHLQGIANSLAMISGGSPVIGNFVSGINLSNLSNINVVPGMQGANTTTASNVSVSNDIAKNTDEAIQSINTNIDLKNKEAKANKELDKAVKTNIDALQDVEDSLEEEAKLSDKVSDEIQDKADEDLSGALDKIDRALNKQGGQTDTETLKLPESSSPKTLAETIKRELAERIEETEEASKIQAEIIDDADELDKLNKIFNSQQEEVEHRISSLFLDEGTVDRVNNALDREKAYQSKKNVPKEEISSIKESSLETQNYINRATKACESEIELIEDTIKQTIKSMSTLVDNIDTSGFTNLPEQIGFDKIKNQVVEILTGEWKYVKDDIDEELVDFIEQVEIQTLSGLLKDIKNDPYYLLPQSTPKVREFYNPRTGKNKKYSDKDSISYLSQAGKTNRLQLVKDHNKLTSDLREQYNKLEDESKKSILAELNKLEAVLSQTHIGMEALTPIYREIEQYLLFNNGTEEEISLIREKLTNSVNESVVNKIKDDFKNRFSLDPAKTRAELGLPKDGNRETWRKTWFDLENKYIPSLIYTFRNNKQKIIDKFKNSNIAKELAEINEFTYRDVTSREPQALMDAGYEALDFDEIPYDAQLYNDIISGKYFEKVEKLYELKRKVEAELESGESEIRSGKFGGGHELEYKISLPVIQVEVAPDEATKSFLETTSELNEYENLFISLIDQLVRLSALQKRLSELKDSKDKSLMDVDTNTRNAVNYSLLEQKIADIVGITDDEGKLIASGILNKLKSKKGELNNPYEQANAKLKRWNKEVESHKKDLNETIKKQRLAEKFYNFDFDKYSDTPEIEVLVNSLDKNFKEYTNKVNKEKEEIEKRLTNKYETNESVRLVLLKSLHEKLNSGEKLNKDTEKYLKDLYNSGNNWYKKRFGKDFKLEDFDGSFNELIENLKVQANNKKKELDQVRSDIKALLPDDEIVKDILKYYDKHKNLDFTKSKDVEAAINYLVNDSNVWIKDKIKELDPQKDFYLFNGYKERLAKNNAFIEKLNRLLAYTKKEEKLNTEFYNLNSSAKYNLLDKYLKGNIDDFDRLNKYVNEFADRKKEHLEIISKIASLTDDNWEDVVRHFTDRDKLLIETKDVFGHTNITEDFVKSLAEEIKIRVNKLEELQEFLKDAQLTVSDCKVKMDILDSEIKMLTDIANELRLELKKMPGEASLSSYENEDSRTNEEFLMTILESLGFDDNKFLNLFSVVIDRLKAKNAIADEQILEANKYRELLEEKLKLFIKESTFEDTDFFKKNLTESYRLMAEKFKIGQGESELVVGDYLKIENPDEALDKALTGERPILDKFGNIISYAKVYENKADEASSRVNSAKYKIKTLANSLLDLNRELSNLTDVEKLDAKAQGKLEELIGGSPKNLRILLGKKNNEKKYYERFMKQLSTSHNELSYYDVDITGTADNVNKEIKRLNASSVNFFDPKIDIRRMKNSNKKVKEAVKVSKDTAQSVSQSGFSEAIEVTYRVVEDTTETTKKTTETMEEVSEETLKWANTGEQIFKNISGLYNQLEKLSGGTVDKKTLSDLKELLLPFEELDVDKITKFGQTSKSKISQSMDTGSYLSNFTKPINELKRLLEELKGFEHKELVSQLIGLEGSILTIYETIERIQKIIKLNPNVGDSTSLNNINTTKLDASNTNDVAKYINVLRVYINSIQDDNGAIVNNLNQLANTIEESNKNISEAKNRLENSLKDGFDLTGLLSKQQKTKKSFFQIAKEILSNTRGSIGFTKDDDQSDDALYTFLENEERNIAKYEKRIESTKNKYDELQKSLYELFNGKKSIKLEDIPFFEDLAMVKKYAKGEEDTLFSLDSFYDVEIITDILNKAKTDGASVDQSLVMVKQWMEKVEKLLSYLEKIEDYKSKLKTSQEKILLIEKTIDFGKRKKLENTNTLPSKYVKIFTEEIKEETKRLEEEKTKLANINDKYNKLESGITDITGSLFFGLGNLYPFNNPEFYNKHREKLSKFDDIYFNALDDNEVKVLYDLYEDIIKDIKDDEVLVDELKKLLTRIKKDWIDILPELDFYFERNQEIESNIFKIKESLESKENLLSGRKPRIRKIEEEFELPETTVTIDVLRKINDSIKKIEEETKQLKELESKLKKAIHERNEIQDNINVLFEGKTTLKLQDIESLNDKNIFNNYENQLIKDNKNEEFDIYNNHHMSKLTDIIHSLSGGNKPVITKLLQKLLNYKKNILPEYYKVNKEIEVIESDILKLSNSNDKNIKDLSKYSTNKSVIDKIKGLIDNTRGSIGIGKGLNGVRADFEKKIKYLKELQEDEKYFKEQDGTDRNKKLLDGTIDSINKTISTINELKAKYIALGGNIDELEKIQNKHISKGSLDTTTVVLDNKIEDTKKVNSKLDELNKTSKETEQKTKNTPDLQKIINKFFSSYDWKTKTYTKYEGIGNLETIAEITKAIELINKDIDRVTRNINKHEGSPDADPILQNNSKNRLNQAKNVVLPLLNKMLKEKKEELNAKNEINKVQDTINKAETKSKKSSSKSKTKSTKDDTAKLSDKIKQETKDLQQANKDISEKEKELTNLKKEAEDLVKEEIETFDNFFKFGKRKATFRNVKNISQVEDAIGYIIGNNKGKKGSPGTIALMKEKIASEEFKDLHKNEQKSTIARLETAERILPILEKLLATYKRIDVLEKEIGDSSTKTSSKKASTKKTSTTNDVSKEATKSKKNTKKANKDLEENNEELKKLLATAKQNVGIEEEAIKTLFYKNKKPFGFAELDTLDKVNRAIDYISGQNGTINKMKANMEADDYENQHSNYKARTEHRLKVAEDTLPKLIKLKDAYEKIYKEQSEVDKIEAETKTKTKSKTKKSSNKKDVIDTSQLVSNEDVAKANKAVDNSEKLAQDIQQVADNINKAIDLTENIKNKNADFSSFGIAGELFNIMEGRTSTPKSTLQNINFDSLEKISIGSLNNDFLDFAEVLELTSIKLEDTISYIIKAGKELETLATKLNLLDDIKSLTKLVSLFDNLDKVVNSDNLQASFDTIISSVEKLESIVSKTSKQKLDINNLIKYDDRLLSDLEKIAKALDIFGNLKPEAFNMLYKTPESIKQSIGISELKEKFSAYKDYVEKYNAIEKQLGVGKDRVSSIADTDEYKNLLSARDELIKLANITKEEAMSLSKDVFGDAWQHGYSRFFGAEAEALVARNKFEREVSIKELEEVNKQLAELEEEKLSKLEQAKEDAKKNAEEFNSLGLPMLSKRVDLENPDNITRFYQTLDGLSKIKTKMKSFDDEAFEVPTEKITNYEKFANSLVATRTTLEGTLNSISDTIQTLVLKDKEGFADYIISLNELSKIYQDKISLLDKKGFSSSNLAYSYKSALEKKGYDVEKDENDQYTVANNKRILQTEKQKANHIAKTREEIERYGKAIRDVKDLFDNKTSKNSFINSQDIQQALSTIQEFEGTYKSLSQLDDDSLFEIDSAEMKSMITAVSQLKYELNNLNTDGLDKLKNLKGQADIKKLLVDFEKFRKEVGKQAPEEVERLEKALLELVNLPMDKLKLGMKDFRTEMSKVKTSLKHVSGGFKEFWSDLYSNFRMFQLGELIGDKIREGVFAIKQVIIEMDDAMREVRKVAQPQDVDTKIDLDKIRNQAFDISRTLGVTANDFLVSLSTSIKLGFSEMDDAMEIARQTMMLANVGDIDAEAASEAVATIKNAYNFSTTKLIAEGITELGEALDIINHVGNNYAISTEGLVDGLKKAAPVAKQFGLEYKEVVGLLTAANTTLQDPDVVGTGVRSIIMRMSGINYDQEEEKIDLNKVGKTLRDVAGIKIFDGKNVKNAVELFEELSAKWESFDQAQRNVISEQLGGKHQAKTALAILDNWETYRDLINDIDTKQHYGSMEKENSEYIDSITGKLNQLKVAWSDILTTVFESDTIKQALDILLKISDVIAKIIDKLDGLRLDTATVLGGSYGFVKLAKYLAEGTTGFMGKSMFTGMLSSIGTTQSEVTELLNSMRAVHTANTVTASTTFFGSIKAGAKGALGLVGSLAKMLAPLAIIGGFALVSNMVNSFDDMYAEIEERTEETRKNIQKTNAKKLNLENQVESYKKANEDIDKLSKKKQTEENKKALEELKQSKTSILQEIASIDRGLVNYDASGNPISVHNEKVKELIADYDVLLERQNKFLETTLSNSASMGLKNNTPDRIEFSSVDEIFKDGFGQGLKNIYNIGARYFSKTNYEKFEKTKKKLYTELFGFSDAELGENLEDLFVRDYGSILDNLAVKFSAALKLGKNLIFDRGNKGVFGNVDSLLKSGIGNIKDSDSLRNYISEAKNVLESSKKELELYYDTYNKDTQYVRDLLNLRIDEMSNGVYGLELLHLKNLITNLDMLDATKGQRFVDTLIEASREGKLSIQDLATKLAEARKEFDKTDNLEKYEEKVNSLTDELIKLLNLDITNPSDKILIDTFKEGASISDIQKTYREYQKMQESIEEYELSWKNQLNEFFSSETGLMSTFALDFIIEEGETPEHLREIALDMKNKYQDSLETSLSEEDAKIITKIANGWNSSIDKTYSSFKNIDDYTTGIKTRVSQLTDEITLYKEIYDTTFGVDNEASVNAVSIINKDMEELSKLLGVSTTELQEFMRYYSEYNNISGKKLFDFSNADSISSVDELIAKNKEFINKYSYLNLSEKDFGTKLFGIDELKDYEKTLDKTINAYKSQIKTISDTKPINYESSISFLNAKLTDLQNEKAKVQVDIEYEMKAEAKIKEQIEKDLDYLNKSPLEKIEFIKDEIKAKKDLIATNKKIIEQSGVYAKDDKPTSGPKKQTSFEDTIRGKGRQIGKSFAEIGVEARLYENNRLENDIKNLEENTIVELKGEIQTDSIKASIKKAREGVSSLVTTSNKEAVGLFETFTAQDGIENVINGKVFDAREFDKQLKARKQMLESAKEMYKADGDTEGVKAVEKELGKINNDITKSEKLVAQKEQEAKKNLTEYLELVKKRNKAIDDGDNKTREEVQARINELEPESLETILQYELDIKVKNKNATDELTTIKNQIENFKKDGTLTVEVDGEEKTININTEEGKKKLTDLENKAKELEETINNTNILLGIGEETEEQKIKITYEPNQESVDAVNSAVDNPQEVTVNLTPDDSAITSFLENKTYSKTVNLIGRFSSGGNGGGSGDNTTMPSQQTFSMGEPAPISETPVATASEATGSTEAPSPSPAIQSRASSGWTTPIRVQNKSINWLIWGVDLMRQISDKIKGISNQLDMLDAKMEHVFGKKKLTYMKEQIKLLEKQKDLHKSYQKQLEDEQKKLKSFLSGQGFKFDSDGGITNYVAKLMEMNKKLDSIKNEKSYEKYQTNLDEIKQALERYLDITFNELPDAIIEWEELENQIKDVYKEQLDIAKETEDKLIEIYEKQIDDHKEMLEEQTENTIKAINKRVEAELDAIDELQKAYNKAREEEDYQEELAEKREELAKIERQIALASRDNSTAGKAKLDKLMEEYDNLKDDLDDFLQDREDKLVNDLFDDEKDRLEKESNKEIERLENELEEALKKLEDTYTEEKLMEMVKEAIASGKFTGIDGTVSDLNEVMLQFLNSTSEGLGATGQVIKNEWIGNLEIAKDVLKDIDNIVKELDLNKFHNNNDLFVPKTVSIAPQQTRAIIPQDMDIKRFIDGVSSASGKTVNFNQPLIQIEGNVTEEVMPKLEKFAKEVERRITSNIVYAMR